MDADVAVTDPRVEPITHPRYQYISVHPRSSVAKISCLRRWLLVCGASRGFADMSGIMEAMYWSRPGSGTASVSRFKGSIRNGLNGMVGTGFAVGSRFKGSIRNGLDGATGPGVGTPCGGRLAEGAESKAAGSEGAAGVRAAYGIPVPSSLSNNSDGDS